MVRLPYELEIEILKYKAVTELKKIIEEQYFLNFDKLKNFLVKYNGLIFGSLAIYCFDLDCPYKDLDICIKFDRTKTHQDCYLEFLEIFTIEKDRVLIIKNPVLNSVNDNTIKYNLKYSYTNQIIDMTLFNENPKNIILDEPFFDISQICFDGITFHFPFGKNYMDILKLKHIKLINPYKHNIDPIYDPYDLNADEIINIANTKILKLENTIKNEKMKEIYDKLVPYYQPKNCVYKLENIIDINKFITGKNIDVTFGKFVYQKGFDTISSGKIIIDIMSSSIDIKQLGEFYRVYRSWFYVLKYIYKGYVIINLDDYLK